MKTSLIKTPRSQLEVLPRCFLLSSAHGPRVSVKGLLGFQGHACFFLLNIKFDAHWMYIVHVSCVFLWCFDSWISGISSSMWSLQCYRLHVSGLEFRASLAFPFFSISLCTSCLMWSLWYMLQGLLGSIATQFLSYEKIHIGVFVPQLKMSALNNFCLRMVVYLVIIPKNQRSFKYILV